MRLGIHPELVEEYAGTRQMAGATLGVTAGAREHPRRCGLPGVGRSKRRRFGLVALSRGGCQRAFALSRADARYTGYHFWDLLSDPSTLAGHCHIAKLRRHAG